MMCDFDFMQGKERLCPVLFSQSAHSPRIGRPEAGRRCKRFQKETQSRPMCMETDGRSKARKGWPFPSLPSFRPPSPHLSDPSSRTPSLPSLPVKALAHPFPLFSLSPPSLSPLSVSSFLPPGVSPLLSSHLRASRTALFLSQFTIRCIPSTWMFCTKSFRHMDLLKRSSRFRNLPVRSRPLIPSHPPSLTSSPPPLSARSSSPPSHLSCSLAHGHYPALMLSPSVPNTAAA